MDPNSVNKIYKIKKNNIDYFVGEYCKLFYDYNLIKTKINNVTNTNEVKSLDIVRTVELEETHIIGISNPDSYEEITKKICLLDERYTISEATENIVLIDRKNVYSENIDESNYSEIGYEFLGNLYLKTGDIKKLGNWLYDSKELIRNNKMIYYPNIFFDGYQFPYKVQTLLNDKLNFENIMALKGSTKKSKLKPLMTIKIPNLEGIDYNKFVHIYLENNEIFKRFNLELKLKLLEINTDDENEFANKCEKIEISMNKEVLSIKEMYDKNIRKYFANILTTGVSTAAVSLFLFKSNTLEELINKLALSGIIGVLPLISATKDYIFYRSELKSNPYFFLWVIS